MRFKCSLKQRLLVGVIAAVLSLSYLFTTILDNTPDEIVFKTITGETINLASLAGKPVLLTFWASDCASCLAEIPDLKQLYENYQAKGLIIIAIAMFYDPPDQVVAASKVYGLPYPVVLDPDGQLASAFGQVKLTPTHILIDRFGKQILHKLGGLTLPEWQGWLDQL